MKTIHSHYLALTTILASSFSIADDKTGTNAVNGVKGVKQEAVESVKKVEPPTFAPTAVTPPQSVNKVDGVNTIQGVKVPGQETTPPPLPPPPAPAGNAAKGINPVEGVQAMPPNAVLPIPPPPAGVVSTIQTVKGVQGIIAPKQRNLEAALLIKEGGEGTPSGSAKGAAAAAALLSAPPVLTPGPPLPAGDGRDAFQEFEKLTAPGS